MERKIAGRGSIEIGVNTRGLIFIKQEGQMGEDDEVVEITSHDVPTVVKWLREAAKDAKNFKPGEGAE